MSKFFINRPIVAMVIALLMVIMGTVSILQLPVAQYPDIVPPEIVVQANYVGADALTIEQAVATPHRGADERRRQHELHVLRQRQQRRDAAARHLRRRHRSEHRSDPRPVAGIAGEREPPADVIQFGVTVQKSYSSPLMLVSLYSPKGTYDEIFLTNYAFINLMDPLTRVPGVGRVQIFGGQYALRCWVKPDRLAKLGITVTEIINAIGAQNSVNPGGPDRRRAGASRPGVHLYRARRRGRLETPEEFGEIIVRANPDGSVLRLRDVARIELGAQTYTLIARYNGSPAAVIAHLSVARLERGSGRRRSPRS